MTYDTRALVLFLTLAVGLIVLIILDFRRRQYRPIQWCLWVMAVYLTRTVWRCSAPRSLPIPPDGRGLVIVANHHSSIDPFFLQTLVDRPMHWMVAKEYCQIGFVSWFLKQCEVIPVSRSGLDTAATKLAIRYAHQGETVGMFPEGRINIERRDFMLPVRPGAVLTALKSNSLILPVYIHNSPFSYLPWGPLFLPSRVIIRVGEFLDPVLISRQTSEDEILRRVMTDAVRAIAGLAGQPHFEPQFAGRKWLPT